MSQVERVALFGLIMGHGMLVSSDPDSLFRVAGIMLMMLSGAHLVWGHNIEERSEGEE